MLTLFAISKLATQKNFENQMSNTKINCPNCNIEIEITESLASPLLKKAKMEFAKQLDQERINISQKERKIAVNKVADEIKEKSQRLTELETLLETRDEKLAEAQKSQVNFMKKQRLLDEEKRELDLVVEKRVQESVVEIHAKAKMEAEGELKLKVVEREQQIDAMKKQIEELRRRSEQGSQQLQGEVMELELEGLLSNKFPFDRIEPVPKGEFGGDVLQRVYNQTDSFAGTILWESKRTKNWSDGWLSKLRNDQRTAKAEVSIIVTQALPKEIENFGMVDGVWITAPVFALGLAFALRQTLVEVAASKNSKVGQMSKMELVYDYLTGSQFRLRVEAIVEKFTEMQLDLDREKKTMMRLWAKREMQIHNVIESTVGMYGDLQGIAGKALQEIEGLEIPLIEDNTE